MDAKLSAIISKAAGTYFIVTDNSDVTTIESTSKMRLFFINSEKGPVNTVVKFAKGAKTSFTSVFGKSTRLKEKRGNFSIQTCLDALSAGPIAVVNLRAFDDTIDKAGIVGVSPNIVKEEELTVPYKNLFNTNKFWTARPKNIPELFTRNNLLNFGNIGNSNLSIFVKFANESDVSILTNQYNETLSASTLEIDDYPTLDPNMLLKETFVSVYIFNNTFDKTTVGTNKYYGQYFDNNGNIDMQNIDNLADIVEAGFIGKYTGSLIPHLITENDVNVSIDNVINGNYITTGLIAYINNDLFDTEIEKLLDINGSEFFGVDNNKVAETADYLLSHVVPLTLTKLRTTYPPVVKADNVIPVSNNKNEYLTVKIDDYSFEGSFEQGLRIGDIITGVDGYVEIKSIDILDADAVIGVSTDTYQKVKYTCNGKVLFTTEDTKTFIVKNHLFTKTGLLHPFALTAYKPRTTQFTDGTSSKQSEIIDMMNNPGIVKGIKSIGNIRYIVDCFKSFVEPNYKYQFGTLAKTLNDSNVFVSAILNEPFIEDLEKSINPLFKESVNGVFDWSYLKTGGNTQYSSKLFTKFTEGSMYCYFYGPGNVIGDIIKGGAGLVSNLFYTKNADYDVVANESGYLDYTEVESDIDDDDRAYCEAFRYNPIINYNGGLTIFGNNSGQKKVTAQTQIHNVELLLYIKTNLYALSKSEAFKKGNYDDYLRSETEVSNFMTSLALAGAIEANPVVICSADNNTGEISKQRIKLIHVEYTPMNALEKVVFDLVIN